MAFPVLKEILGCVPELLMSSQNLRVASLLLLFPPPSVRIA